MSTALLPERVKETPPAPAKAALAAPANSAAPAAPPEAAPPSDAWVGDRIALVVWMIAASILAFLLLKDIIFAVLFGHS